MLQLVQRAGLQQILDNPVEFVKASTPFGHTATHSTDGPVVKSNANRRPSNEVTAGEALKVPKIVLFPENGISLSWQKIMLPPPGLHNTGNTCFLNSVMQVLMHLPGLVVFLLSGQHAEACRLNNCILCKLEEHAKRAYPGNGTKRGSPFRPAYTQNIRQIGKQFKPGRQEDAHEFLILLLDQLQQNSLQGQPKGLDHRSKETTVIHRLFGGHLRQQIICGKCRVPSNTYEATLVLSIDCLSTVEQGLSRLTAAEVLSGRNKYKCEKCKTLQEARKQTTIFDAPNNLVIHVKRFQFASKSSKISKPIAFGENLDLSKFMAQGRHAGSYKLAGVVVHQGSGVSSGHYYAFGRGSNGTWNEFNDSSVSQAGFDRVQKQQAYMLFYTRNVQTAADTGETSVPGSDSLSQKNKRPVSDTSHVEATSGSQTKSFDEITNGVFKKKRKHTDDSHEHRKKHRLVSQMKKKQ